MGGKGGGGKKGGGGGSVDVDVDSDSASSTVLDIVGLDDIQVTTNATSSSTNRLELPDPIDTRMTISVPDTIRTDQKQRSELAITEPIVTHMSTDLDVDMKPVVVDLCLTLGIKDPPRFRVSRPYDKHVGMSLFGREIVGFDWCGTSDFIVDDVRPGGFTAGVTDGSVHRSRHHERHEHHEGHGSVSDDEFERNSWGERPGVRFVID
jgi:hypothetical protein